MVVPLSPVEIQEEHLDSLLKFINQPDEDIFKAGYERVLQGEMNYLFDSDKVNGKEGYERALEAFREKERKEADLLVGEAIFKEDDELDGVWKKIARAVEMPEERIEGAGKELDSAIEDHLEESGKRVVLFLTNIHHLDTGIQANIRGLSQTLFGRIKAKYFALGSGKKLGRQDWDSSPLANIFIRPEEELVAFKFDPQLGKGTVEAYRRAINQLKTEDSARVTLPSRTGKSTFARLLSSLKSSEANLVNLERYLTEDGRGVKFDRLVSENPNRNREVVLVDESQVLTGEQREKLVDKWGKVVFIENADLLPEQ